MTFERNILLCITGTTPQVVTETLWALTSQGERIDEIRVITSLAGRERIERDLLDPKTGQFFAFCRDYGIDPQNISFDERNITLLHLPDGKVLDDIRTIEENRHAANLICEIVRELTRDEKTRIFASMAGGRRTMGIYLTAGMQLYARSWDSLSHVLISRDFEGLDDFYYIPPTPRQIVTTNQLSGRSRTLSTADAEIHLAPIAFIRLRGIQGRTMIGDGKNYEEIVESLQSNLDLMEHSYDLRINPANRSIEVSGHRVRLTEREMFIYLLFAWYRKYGGEKGDGYRSISEITCSDLDQVFRLITHERGEEIGIAEAASYPRYNFLKILSDQVSSRLDKDRENTIQVFRETRARINRKIEEAGLPAQYQIGARGARGSISYGLGVKSGLIDWRISK